MHLGFAGFSLCYWASHRMLIWSPDAPQFSRCATTFSHLATPLALRIRRAPPHRRAAPRHRCEPGAALDLALALPCPAVSRIVRLGCAAAQRPLARLRCRCRLHRCRRMQLQCRFVAPGWVGAATRSQRVAPEPAIKPLCNGTNTARIGARCAPAPLEPIHTPPLQLLRVMPRHFASSSKPSGATRAMSKTLDTVLCAQTCLTAFCRRGAEAEPLLQLRKRPGLLSTGVPLLPRPR